MSQPLDELYLTWLYSQIGSVRLKNPSQTHWSLVRQLYSKEFVWIVPNDDNRVEDGRDLRYEFIDEQMLEDVDPAWLDLGCSMLEMLIGLSRRLSFEAEGESRDWFWTLINNLALRSDDKNPILVEVVDATLERVIWRTYNPDGSGGLFPLRRAHKNQRKVEIWYQLSAYLLER